MIGLICLALGITGCTENKTQNGVNGDSIFEFTPNSASSYEVSVVSPASEVVFPSEYNGKPVTEIGGVSIDTTYILKSITIPESIKKIHNAAFAICYKLEEVNFNAVSCEDFEFKNNIFANAGQSGQGIVLNVGENVEKIPANFFYPFYDKSHLPYVKVVNFNGNSSCNTIGKDAFLGCSDIEAVNIKELSDWCRIKFLNLYSNPSIFSGNLIIENSVSDSSLSGINKIEDFTFFNCKTVSELKLPDTVTEIGKEAFKFSCITNIYGANKLVKIEESAFESSNLNNITIPESVTYIGNFAFYNCCAIEEVHFNAVNCADLKEYNKTFVGAGNIYGYKVIIGSSVKKIPDYLFSGYDEDELSCVVTVEFAQNCMCETIGDAAFNCCVYLLNFTLPSQLKNIGALAFCNCLSITELTIPETVINIGYGAFYNTVCLTQINFNAVKCNDVGNPNEVFAYAGSADNGIAVKIGASVTKIPSYLFCDKVDYAQYTFFPLSTNKVISVEFEGNNCKSIGYFAFSCCNNLTEFTVPESVNIIDDGAFCDCKGMCNLSLGNVKKIGAYAFRSCGINNGLIIPESVESVNEGAFRGCAYLKNLEIKSGIICDYAFEACTSLEMATICGSEYIGDFCFENCSNLTEVTIGGNVSDLGDYAFSNCGIIEKLTVDSAIETIGQFAFSDTHCMKVHIKDLSDWFKTLFKNQDSNPLNGSKFYLNEEELIDIVIPEEIDAVNSFAFFGCKSINSLVIPGSVKTVGSFAFFNCSNLKSVALREGVIGINQKAFGGYTVDCPIIAELVLPKSLTLIGEQAFPYSGMQQCDLFYGGTEYDFENISIESNNNMIRNFATTIYYYIEAGANLPDDGGNYWHYDADGVTPVIYTTVDNSN